MYKYNAVAEKVFNFVPSIPFNNEGYFTEEDVDELISDITVDDFNYETGATKCVIIPEDTDFVIKIPFNATISSCDDCEYWQECFNCNHSCPNHSFKNGGGSNHDNYCALEEELYSIIKKKYSQFIGFFLPVKKICEVDDYPIYIQKKAEIFENKIYPTSENSKEKVESCRSFLVTAPVEWLAKCLEDMNNDLDMYNDFLNMLIDLDINADLHRGNVGYYNGHAVLIDYAGFRDK